MEGRREGGRDREEGNEGQRVCVLSRCFPIDRFMRFFPQRLKLIATERGRKRARGGRGCSGGRGAICSFPAHQLEGREGGRILGGKCVRSVAQRTRQVVMR